MKKILVYLMLAAMISSAYALQVKTEIVGLVGGYMDYVDYDTNVKDGPQEFTINWINTGSVGCRMRFRFDITNANKSIDSAWSNELPIDAGASGLFHAYWKPNESGAYTARIRIYQCRTIKDGPEFNFTAVVSGAGGENPFNISVDNDMESIKLKVRSGRDFEKLIVVPEGYPIGWVVESADLNLTKDEEKTVVLGYFPEIWKPADVSFLVTTPDGAYSQRLTYKLQDRSGGYDIKTVALYALSLLCLMLVMALVFLHQKYRKISQKG